MGQVFTKIFIDDHPDDVKRLAELLERLIAEANKARSERIERKKEEQKETIEKHKPKAKNIRKVVLMS